MSGARLALWVGFVFGFVALQAAGAIGSAVYPRASWHFVLSVMGSAALLGFTLGALATYLVRHA